MIKLLNESELPNGFKYPDSIHKLVELNLTNFDVWYLMDGESIKTRLKGVQNRYPNRKLIPFARRGDCDDIACFEIGHEAHVFIIHDFASSGYEQQEIFESVWDWVQYAVGIMIDFEKIEGIE